MAPVPTVIHLSPGLTGFVGANASGKTAALQALMRLFGVTRALRTVVLFDFHVPSTETERPKSRALTINVRLSLPKLEKIGVRAGLIRKAPTSEPD